MNIRNASEGKLARDLAYVFAQLSLMNLGEREREWPAPLTSAEYRHRRRERIRRRRGRLARLRRDLKASLDLIERESSR